MSLFLDEYLWLLGAVPMVIVLVWRLVRPHKITNLEGGATVGLSLFLLTILYVGGLNKDMLDKEVINGAVVDKEVRKSICKKDNGGPYCRSDYPCDPYTVRYSCTKTKSNGDTYMGTCTRTEWHTCYKYPWEQSYFAITNVNKAYEIDRADPQGAQTPIRWDEVKIGDPVSYTQYYKNWIRAADAGLYHMKNEVLEDSYKEYLTEYPLSVYDYYKIDRVQTVGFDLPDIKQWNESLSYVLGQVGPTRQANLVMVISKSPSSTMVDAVVSHWVGGKKNDTILGIGVDDDFKIQWVRVKSWSKKSMYDIVLRDEISEIGTLDREAILKVIHKAIDEHFERLTMEEIEQLRPQVTPPDWLLYTCLIIGIGLTVGLMVFMDKNDVFRT